MNIFVDAGDASRALGQLPEGVRITEKDVAMVERDGQARLDWNGVPIDVFLNNLPLHEEVAKGIVWVPLEGRQIPVLDCSSLVIFKAFFDRTKDWADIEAVAAATSKDIDAAARTLAELVGEEDPAFKRLVSVRKTKSR